MRFAFDQDFHIHTHLSTCSHDPLQTKETILEYGERNGLKHLCITDHFWSKEVPGASQWYTPQNEEHIRETLPLPQSDKVRLHFGCEAELNKDMTLSLKPELFDSFEFVIIPTTHLHMKGFTIKENPTLEERAEAYVSRLEGLLNMDLPFHKIGLAHPTDVLLAPANWEDHTTVLKMIPDATYKKLFTKIAKKGMGFEFNNMAIFRYTEEQLAVQQNIYGIAKDAGCKFYFGSDSHKVTELAEAPAIFNRMVEVFDLKEEDKFNPFND